MLISWSSSFLECAWLPEYGYLFFSPEVGSFQLLFFQISFLPHLSLSPSGTPIMYILVCCWIISHKFLKLSSLFYYLFSSLTRWFLMTCLRVHWSFLDLAWCWTPLVNSSVIYSVLRLQDFCLVLFNIFYLLVAVHAFLLIWMSNFMMVSLNFLSGKSCICFIRVGF